MVEKANQKDLEKEAVKRSLSQAQKNLERALNRLSMLSAVEEAFFVKKAIAEIKKTMRQL